MDRVQVVMSGGFWNNKDATKKYKHLSTIYKKIDLNLLKSITNQFKINKSINTYTYGDFDFLKYHIYST